MRNILQRTSKGCIAAQSICWVYYSIPAKLTLPTNQESQINVAGLHKIFSMSILRTIPEQVCEDVSLSSPVTPDLYHSISVTASSLLIDLYMFVQSCLFLN